MTAPYSITYLVLRADNLATGEGPAGISAQQVEAQGGGLMDTSSLAGGGGAPGNMYSANITGLTPATNYTVRV